MAKPDYIAFNMAATISSLAKMRVRWGVSQLAWEKVRGKFEKGRQK